MGKKGTYSEIQKILILCPCKITKILSQCEKLTSEYQANSSKKT